MLVRIAESLRRSARCSAGLHSGLSLVDTQPFPRENEIDFLTEAKAEAAFAPPQPKKTASKKAKTPTPIKAAQKKARTAHRE
jgi:hypothetical protein